MRHCLKPRCFITAVCEAASKAEREGRRVLRPFSILHGLFAVDNRKCAALVKKGCTITTTRTDLKIDVVMIIMRSHRYKGICEEDVTFVSPTLPEYPSCRLFYHQDIRVVPTHTKTRFRAWASTPEHYNPLRIKTFIPQTLETGIQ